MSESLSVAGTELIDALTRAGFRVLRRQGHLLVLARGYDVIVVDEEGRVTGERLINLLRRAGVTTGELEELLGEGGAVPRRRVSGVFDASPMTRGASDGTESAADGDGHADGCDEKRRSGDGALLRSLKTAHALRAQCDAAPARMRDIESRYERLEEGIRELEQERQRERQARRR